MFGIYAGVDPENAEEALCEIRRELDRLSEPLTAAELDRAQAVARSRIQLSIEDTRAVSGWYGSQATRGRPLRSPEETIARYQSVTLENLQAVAERIIQPDLAHLAIVGPYESAAPFEAAFNNA
jgi:predicted Zn-dependent peptidase